MSPPCSLCNDLEKRSPDDDRLALDFTYEMLSRDGKTGACKPCALLLEAIERFVTSPEQAISRVYVYGLDANNNTLSIEVYYKEDRPKLTLELFHHLGDCEASGLPWPAIRAKPMTKGHPLEQSSLQWVKTLLQDCGAQNSSNKLPKRVLKLDQEDRDISVCLEENGTSREGSYATLSHCWGLDQTCITTTSNIRQRKDGIPWTEIPQTFKDVIRYCLALGIHYLWIDALCIIQDSREDWQRESRRMGKIFHRSLLTIAATSSPNSTAGCFAGYHQAGHHEDLVLESTSGDFPPVVARPAHRHWTLPSTSASQPYWPLLSRGWAFQEILLSPRVIHIGRTELIWESATQTQCECGASITGLKQDTRLDDMFTTTGHSNPLHRRLQMRWKRLSQSVIGNPTYLPSSSERRLWNTSQEWRNIIEHYSALDLTKSSDCLPALSGLAHRSGSVLGKSNGSSGPTYLAGLWKMTLLGDLFWRVDRLRPSSNALSTYRAPSWSWASVCTNVQYWAPTDLEGGSGCGLDILSCDVKVAGKNPFGEVDGGRLVLSGRLTEAKVVFISHRVGQGEESSSEHDPLHYEVAIDSTDVGSVQLPFYCDYILSSDGPEHVNDGEVVFLLQVTPELCLVLRPTGPEKEFRRLGIFRAPRAYSQLYGVRLLSDGPPEEITIV